jgi:hypothetical protein
VLVKMQRIGPQFMTELTQIGVAATARRMPELMERLNAAIESWRQRARPQPPSPAS